MKARSAPTAAILVALLAAGCAQDGTLTTGGLNTSSIDQAGVAKSDPACLTLAAQIEALNRDGTIDKVSKAAAKKYKLKTEDLAKADELNKANNEFQTKCSAYPPRPVVAATTTPTTTSTTTTTTAAATKDAKDTKEKKVAVKKTAPPVPAAKPPASTAAATPPPAATTTPAPQTAENPDPTLPQP
jgi:hypothetical protein